jgi:hypothetical protein
MCIFSTTERSTLAPPSSYPPLKAVSAMQDKQCYARITTTDMPVSKHRVQPAHPKAAADCKAETHAATNHAPAPAYNSSVRQQERRHSAEHSTRNKEPPATKRCAQSTTLQQLHSLCRLWLSTVRQGI